MDKGIGVSKGIGIGKAYVVKEQNINLPRYRISNIGEEMRRYDGAVEDFVKGVTEKGKERKGDEAQILLAHASLANDPVLRDSVKERLEKEQENVEQAVNKAFNQVVDTFSAMEDELLRERASDLRDVRDKVLSLLMGAPLDELSDLEEGSVLIAKELTPSMTAAIDTDRVKGFVTEMGGSSSHVAIIARSLGIPAVVGAKGVFKKLKGGEPVLLDGETGEVYIHPEREVVERLQEKRRRLLSEKSELERYRGVPARTKDAKTFEIFANVGSASDVDAARANDAQGVGLFRTEFLFMGRNLLPTEDEQFKEYKKAAMRLEGRTLIIRTLDVGGDKDVPYLNLTKEENPFLGLRGVRYCLKNRELFQTQVRAILRAGAFADVRILIPMVSDVAEFRLARQVVEDAKLELKEKGVEYREDVMVGVMMETPAAAVLAGFLVKEADFFSIGTNDLTQYVMAVDRGNEAVMGLYSHYSPAVIRLVLHVVEVAKEKGIPVGMCGEAAADPLYIPFLLALGIDELSVSPSAVLEVRRIICETDVGAAKKKVENLLRQATIEEVEHYLKTYYIP